MAAVPDRSTEHACVTAAAFVHVVGHEPLPDEGALARSVRWVLSNPQVFLNSSSDARLLPIILDAAEQGGPPPGDAELEADLAAFDVRPLFDGAELERI